MLLNEFLPVYDVHERHEIIVRVLVEQVYAKLWDINFGAAENTTWARPHSASWQACWRRYSRQMTKDCGESTGKMCGGV